MTSTQPSSLSDPGVDPESIVIYTAITGDYDSLKEPPRTATHGVELVAFVDRNKPNRDTQWQRRIPHQGFTDQSRNAKIHKILSHIYFPDKTYSLWIDGSVTIKFSFSIERLISEYLADSDLALFKHYRRTCLYQEAGVALHRRLDDPTIIRRQIESYTRDGYPANAGLSECCVLLRRHTDAIKDFNEAWWEEIRRGSVRDQISFDYVARRCGLKYRYFPGSVEHPNALFGRGYHQNQSRRILARRGVRFLGTACDGFVTPLVRPVLEMLGRNQVGIAGAGKRTPPPSFTNIGVATEPASGNSIGGNASGGWSRSSCFSLRATRRTVAFGPERDFPSWDWVGFDTSRELSKYYQMTIYNSSRTDPPDCDVLFIVKVKPPAEFVAAARRKGSRIVYCPIDFYESQEQLRGDADFLRACDMVLVHSERLLPLVQTYCPNTYFVEHHSRYSLTQMADYKDNGFVLWVGGCQYLASFIGWLQKHPIGAEVKILTDIDKAWSIRGARRYATLSLSRKTWSIAGCEIYPWSEKLQFEMLRECKAAIDVKQVEIFNQYYKPPTKAQKYVGSGIPFAVNPESYSAEYFAARGFVVASPSDSERWFSRDYWEETRRFGLKLREYTSLEAVGSRYKDLIESLL